MHVHAADMATELRGRVISAGLKTAQFGTAISQMLKYQCIQTISMAQSCPGSTGRVRPRDDC